MSETGTVRKIVFAAWTGSTPAAQPAVPALGGNVTWATPWLKRLGGQPGAGDLGKLDVDSVAIKPFEEGLDIDPPLAQNKLDRIQFGNGVEAVTFSVYSDNEDIFELPNTAAEVAGTIEEGVTFVYKSMCIEVTGICVEYFPKVRVKIVSQAGAIKKPWKVDFLVKTFGTATIPSGKKRISFT